jgi:hypothetical protein
MFVRDRTSVKKTQALAVLGTVLAALVFAVSDSAGSVQTAGPLILAVALGAAALEAVSIELVSLVQGSAAEESESDGASQLQDAVSACLGITVGCLVMIPAIDLQHSMEHGLFSGINERMLLFTVLPHAVSSIVQMTLVSMVGPTTPSLMGSLDIVAAFVLMAAVSRSLPPNLAGDLMLMSGPVLCIMMHYIGVLDVDSAAVQATSNLLSELQEAHKPAAALPNLLTAFKNRMSVMVGVDTSKLAPTAVKAPAAVHSDAFASSASEGVDLGSLEDYNVSL